jgi:hypothetical protein
VQWSGDRQAHGQWCASFGGDYRELAKAQQQKRVDALRRCAQINAEKQRVCADYAKTAIKQQAQNLAERCGFKGPEWQADYDHHYDWCVHGDNYRKQAPGATRARNEALGRCVKKATAPCELYEHSSLRGAKYDVARNQKFDFAKQPWNDRASSVKVPDGCRLTVFHNLKLTGGSRTFPPGVHNKLGEGWNDHITSGTCTCK